ncbi:MAG: hypothetical protein WCK02_09770 [Bacteroidota bacterium]
MNCLTNEQINFVISEVNSAEITFSHLKDDLIDHLCCEIEAEIRRGYNFEEAFNKINQSVGVKSLRKVQENTLLLIDKKYRFMKRTMKTSGMISMGMLAFGALFKIMHWPGAGPLLVFGFFFLSILFLPTALWVMRKESKLKSPLLLYISGLIGGVIVMAGFLFKIMHWPGAGPMLVFGYSFFACVFMPTLLYSLLKTNDQKPMKIAYIIGVISFTICLIGDLFKIMHWPGAGPMLVFGTVLLVCFFFPFYSYLKYKDSKSIEGSFLFLSIGLLFFTLFNNILSMNVSRNVLGQFIPPVNRTISAISNIEDNNKKCYQLVLSDSMNTNKDVNEKLSLIQKESDKLCYLIKDTKLDIIAKVDGMDRAYADTIIKNLDFLGGKDNYDYSTYVMIGPNRITGEGGKANEIKKKIENYKTLLSDVFKANESRTTLINKLFDVSDKYNPKLGAKATWEMNNFYYIISISAIDILSNIEMNVRLAESEAIRELTDSKKLKNSKKIVVENKSK